MRTCRTLSTLSLRTTSWNHQLGDVSCIIPKIWIDMVLGRLKDIWARYGVLLPWRSWVSMGIQGAHMHRRIGGLGWDDNLKKWMETRDMCAHHDQGKMEVIMVMWVLTCFFFFIFPFFPSLILVLLSLFHILFVHVERERGGMWRKWERVVR